MIYEDDDDDSDYVNYMSDDRIEYPETGICNDCNGSGEGAFEGTICPACKGKGES